MDIKKKFANLKNWQKWGLVFFAGHSILVIYCFIASSILGGMEGWALSAVFVNTVDILIYPVFIFWEKIFPYSAFGSLSEHLLYPTMFLVGGVVYGLLGALIGYFFPNIKFWVKWGFIFVMAYLLFLVTLMTPGLIPSNIRPVLEIPFTMITHGIEVIFKINNPHIVNNPIIFFSVLIIPFFIGILLGFIYEKLFLHHIKNSLIRSLIIVAIGGAVISVASSQYTGYKIDRSRPSLFILGQVEALQEKARLANTGVLGDGEGTIALRMGKTIKTISNLDAIHVFGKSVNIEDLKVILSNRTDSYTNEKSPMKGNFSDLNYVVLSIVKEALDPSMIPIIRNLLEDPDEVTRAYAAIALIYMGEQDASLREAIEKIAFSESALQSVRSRVIEIPGWVPHSLTDSPEIHVQELLSEQPSQDVVIVSTDNSTYLKGEGVRIMVQNTSADELWIITKPTYHNDCRIPFSMLKSYASQWTPVDENLFPEINNQFTPLSICQRSESKKLPANSKTEYVFDASPFESGTYRLDVEYAYVDPSVEIQQIAPYSSSNEFALRDCTSNSECVFQNDTSQFPVIYGICLNGACVKSCDSEEYTTHCK